MGTREVAQPPAFFTIGMVQLEDGLGSRARASEEIHHEVVRTGCLFDERADERRA